MTDHSHRAVVKKRRRVVGELFAQVVAEVRASVDSRTVEEGEAAGQLPSG